MTIDSRITMWREYRSPPGANPCTGTGVTPLQFTDWVRLLVGKCLSLSQVSPGTSGRPEIKYLALGVPVTEMRDRNDQDGLKMAAMAIKADFKQLRGSISEFKRMLDQPAIESPESFLRSFHLLIGLRLPTEPSRWIATDEGLNIIHWGLNEIPNRPLLQWTDDQLRGIEETKLAEIGLASSPDVAVAQATNQARSIRDLIGYRPAAAARPGGASQSKQGWDWKHWVLLISTVLCLFVIGVLVSRPHQNRIPEPAVLPVNDEGSSAGTAAQSANAIGDKPANAADADKGAPQVQGQTPGADGRSNEQGERNGQKSDQEKAKSGQTTAPADGNKESPPPTSEDPPDKSPMETPKQGPAPK